MIDLVIPETFRDSLDGKLYKVIGIGRMAFMNCTSLTSISIPESVTTIESYAFRECFALTTINIPNGITSLTRDIFKDCRSLRSVNIPDSVTVIETGAFDGCTSLTDINIPNNITIIVGAAFQNCSSLLNISIPSCVTRIDSLVFNQCNKLTSINIDKPYGSIPGAPWSAPIATVNWNNPYRVNISDQFGTPEENGAGIYYPGMQVNLTAVPDPSNSQTFYGWDNRSEGSIIINPSNRSSSAYFTMPEHDVDITIIWEYYG